MRAWLPLRGPKSIGGSAAIGAVSGLAGTALWIALVEPFAPAAAEPFGDAAWLARALAATALPPLVEEPLLLPVRVAVDVVFGHAPIQHQGACPV
jgi:hypothetical protein